MHIDLVLSEVSGAQRRLETVAGGLGDDEVRAPSALDGWTRGHVLTHLARNADSQTGMLEGARRGEIVAQYPGGDEQRSGDIERGAGRSADEIVADLVAAAAAAFLPPELDRLPLRLPPALAGADPGDIVLDGEPGECLLWLMGRPADSVRLRVSGST